MVLPTLAGPEIGVASTKAFTCQLTVLACLAIALGRARGAHRARTKERELVQALAEVPRHIATLLRDEAASSNWRTSSPRRATCSTWAAASTTRSRWKAR